jgi:hypothetical protein
LVIRLEVIKKPQSVIKVVTMDTETVTGLERKLSDAKQSPRAKPTLPILACLSDAPRSPTRDERIETLLREDAEAKAQIERLKQKRADLKELLKEMGEDAFDRWYFQEHGEDMARIKQKEEKRQERRAALEERQRQIEERRAGMNSEALTNLQNKIAALDEQTKEELHEERGREIAQRREALGNRVNGSGDAA